MWKNLLNLIQAFPIKRLLISQSNERGGKKKKFKPLVAKATHNKTPLL
jgi:hypothetical protein